MVKPVPSYLKLHTHERDLVPPDVEDVAGLAPLCEAFSRATGWPLRFVAGAPSDDDVDLMWSAPIDPGVGASLGHFRIELGAARNIAELAARVPLETAEELASSIVKLLQQTFTLKKTLWKREAELAAGVPVAERPDEPQHLAMRLEGALRSGVQLLRCQAAALYTLDEATTELKLRSSFGLPFDRLEQPARPLATALADLEALLGHAVALDSTQSCRPWNVPEKCQAAVCVPVSNPTMPLGTLWFFCSSPREFTSDETNLAEVIAGRLASELDRALLLHQQVQAVTAQRQLDEASRMQQHSLAHTPPPIDGWQLAGWTCQAGPLGGAFHDWRMLNDGRVAIAVADACDGGMPGAMTAAALRAALPGYLDSLASPAEILARLHELLQAHTAGDQLAGIVLALVSPATGEISLGWAGRPSALWLPAEQPQSLLTPSTPLGLGDRLHQKVVTLSARPGDVLVLYNRGFVEVSDEQGRPLNETALAQALFQARDRSPNDLIDVLCDRQEAHALKPDRLDRSVVVIKRNR